MKQPDGLGQPQELSIKLTPWMAASEYLLALLQVSEQGLLHFRMNNFQVLLGAEFAKMTSWQDSKKFNGVHGLHITILSKAVTAELVWVEKRGEASIHVEGFMVKALEDLARNVGLQSILGMVACNGGGDSSGTGGKIVSGCGGSFN